MLRSLFLSHGFLLAHPLVSKRDKIVDEPTAFLEITFPSSTYPGDRVTTDLNPEVDKLIKDDDRKMSVHKSSYIH